MLIMLRSFALLYLTAIVVAQNIYNGKSDGLSGHTVYMPPGTGKVPVVVWSSGGCIREGGLMHQPALRELANHGVMLIAAGSMGGAFSKRSHTSDQGLYKRQMGSSSTYQDEALNWLDKNAGKGKYARVDKTRVAVAGQSCGGLESYTASRHPLVKVVGIFNSGMFSSSPVVKGFRKPVFYFLGGSTDIAYSNGERDYKELPSDVPTWKGNLPVGHMATYHQTKGGKFGTAMWKFFDWTLRGNESSAAFFTDDGPGSAKADGWSIERRNLAKIRVAPIG